MDALNDSRLTDDARLLEIDNKTNTMTQHAAQEWIHPTESN